MAGNFTFDLVSPEKLLASVEATAVDIPGIEGDMTVMAGHSPLITALRPGILRVTSAEGAEEYVVSGGFAEIGGQSVHVLADRSVKRSEMTQEIFDDFVADAKRMYKKIEEQGEGYEGPADEAARLMADMVAMGGNIGLRMND